MPDIHVNLFAVLVCVLVSMPVGFLWFGPLFGKTWARHMGMENMTPGGAMAKPMAIYAAGSFLIAYTLAEFIGMSTPSTWDGVQIAFCAWIGFFLPVQMGRVAWEQKRWGLVAINASFDLTRLMIFGLILAYWR